MLLSFDESIVTKRLIVLILSIGLWGGCNRLSIENQSFSSKIWKNDKAGCKGERLQFKQGLASIEDQIKGKAEADVVEILGKPDRVDLFKRGQKFFVYWLNHPNCKSDTTLPSMYVEVRFNSIDVASELSLIQSNSLK